MATTLGHPRHHVPEQHRYISRPKAITANNGYPSSSRMADDQQRQFAHQPNSPPQQAPPSHYRDQQPTRPAPRALPPSPPKQQPQQRKQRESKGKLSEAYEEPPSIIKKSGGILLQRGRMLGEGGFARVFEGVQVSPTPTTQEEAQTVALKCISKRQLSENSKNKSKLFVEIKLHNEMNHPNIVRFEGCFEDQDNVYMQMELCQNGSLLDLLKKRKRYSEHETRYYLVQLIGACEYMHSKSVIHRDLKLGNLMFDERMNLKVGDFGLAALVKFPGERKTTICGTPNYIAPEILFDQTNGHSFEVDIWSIGVIMYTLLIGKPPFQTRDVKDIYRKIKDGNYEFPANVPISTEAVDLISQILTTNPQKRPTLREILAHPFFTSGPFPSVVPTIALTSTPPMKTNLPSRWRHNFESVKLVAGIQPEEDLNDPPTATNGSANANVNGNSLAAPMAGAGRPLETVQEQDFERKEEEPKRGVVERRPRKKLSGERRVVSEAQAQLEVREMEKEVREALQAESPVADLLRSARKPLMVSPNSGEQRETLQRKFSARLMQEQQQAAAGSSRPPSRLVTSASSSGPFGRGGGEKENVAPHDGLGGPFPQQQQQQQQRRERAREDREVFVENRDAAEHDVASHKARLMAGMVGSTRTMQEVDRDDGGRDGGGRVKASVSSPAKLNAIRRLALGESLNAASEMRRQVQSAPALAGAAVGAGHVASKEVPLNGGGKRPTLPAAELYGAVHAALESGLSATTSAAVRDLSAPTDFQCPKVFISSWVDYTHKYGTAYALTDGSAGIYFNDSTTMILSPAKSHFDYISNRKGHGHVYNRRNHAIESHPDELERKVFLLKYFDNYMSKQLNRDVPWTFEDLERSKNMVFLVKYYRMKNAILFKLSHDVLQFNFFDHTKVIISERGSVLTFINQDQRLRTYSIASLMAEAHRLGLYSEVEPVGSDDKLAKKQENMSFLISKLEYCRDVLKGLARKKESLKVKAARGEETGLF